MRNVAAIILVLLTVLSAQAQSKSSVWCGYALIEGVPDLETKLPLLSRLTVDEQPDSNPSDLFQVRLSLDGQSALIEGCWIVPLTRDLILNWLSLAEGDEQKQTTDETLVLTLFAPGGSREDSAASVRVFLSEHLKEWELPEG